MFTRHYALSTEGRRGDAEKRRDGDWRAKSMEHREVQPAADSKQLAEDFDSSCLAPYADIKEMVKIARLPSPWMVMGTIKLPLVS